MNLSERIASRLPTVRSECSSEPRIGPYTSTRPLLLSRQAGRFRGRNPPGQVQIAPFSGLNVHIADDALGTGIAMPLKPDRTIASDVGQEFIGKNALEHVSNEAAGQGKPFVYLLDVHLFVGG